MAFTMVLTDRGGTSLGEVRDAHVRSLRVPLRGKAGLATLAFTLQAENPAVIPLLKKSKTLVKLYDDATGTNVLRFYGPCVNYNKTRDSSGGSVAFTAAGPGWRVAHRLIGRSLAGAVFGTALAPLDLGEIHARIIEALNRGETTNVWTLKDDTGIRRGSLTAVGSSYYGPARYYKAGQAITDLAATLDGYDYEYAPSEPTPDADGLKIASLNVAPAFGTLQSNVAFEFGTGKLNVASWSDVGDDEAAMNSGAILPDGWPDTATQAPLFSVDNASIAARGLLEDVIDSSGLTVDTLRQNLISEHVAVRTAGRRIINFTPVAEDPGVDITKRRVPRLWIDFDLGDVVHFRAEEKFPNVDQTTGGITSYSRVKTVDGLFRIFVVELQPDDNGVNQATVTLVEET